MRLQKRKIAIFGRVIVAGTVSRRRIGVKWTRGFWEAANWKLFWEAAEQLLQGKGSC